MNINTKNNFANNNILNSTFRKRHSKGEFKDLSANKNNNFNRPAQAISFGGSVVSKLEEVQPNKLKQGINKIVAGTFDNEVAFKAGFSLFVAGMLKPYCIIKQKGGDKKDKQYIATKNFLNAFISSFFLFTIGGKFFNKIAGNIENNLSLVSDKLNDGKLQLVAEDSPEAIKTAKSILDSDAKSFGQKIARGKQASKNAQGFGKIKEFFNGFSARAPKPSKEAIKNKAQEIVKNAQKHLEVFNKKPDVVVALKGNDNLMEAYKSVNKNIAGAPIAIAKVKISSFLLPIVVAKFFADKQKDKNSEKLDNTSSILLKNSIQNSQNDTFKSFEKNDKNKNVSFTGDLLDKALESTTLGYEKFSLSKPYQGFIGFLNKIPFGLNEKVSALMDDLESFMVTGLSIYNIEKSKNIPKDQKFGLNLNTLLVTIVATFAAHGTDIATDGIIRNAKNKYQQNVKEIYQKVAKNCDEEDIQGAIKAIQGQAKNLYHSEDVVNGLLNEQVANIREANGDLSALKNTKALIEETDIDGVAKSLAKDYEKGLKKFKSLTLFALTVRFLVPVLMVPISGKIKKKILAKKAQKEQQGKVELNSAQKPNVSVQNSNTKNQPIQK